VEVEEEEEVEEQELQPAEHPQRGEAEGLRRGGRLRGLHLSLLLL